MTFFSAAHVVAMHAHTVYLVFFLFVAVLIAGYLYLYSARARHNAASSGHEARSTQQQGN